LAASNQFGKPPSSAQQDRRIIFLSPARGRGKERGDRRV